MFKVTEYEEFAFFLVMYLFFFSQILVKYIFGYDKIWNEIDL